MIDSTRLNSSDDYGRSGDDGRKIDDDDHDDNDDGKIDDPMEIARIRSLRTWSDENKKRRLSEFSTFADESTVGRSSSSGSSNNDGSGLPPTIPNYSSLDRFLDVVTPRSYVETHEGSSDRISKRTRMEGDDPCWGDTNTLDSGIDNRKSEDESHEMGSAQQKSDEVEMVGVDDRYRPTNENKDDDSGVDCLGTMSNNKSLDDDIVNSHNISWAISTKGAFNHLLSSTCNDHCESCNDVHTDEVARSRGTGPANYVDGDRKSNDIFCSSSEGLNVNNRDSDCISKTPSDTSTNEGICYICGSDLSRLKTGLRGRVAHMKRCSAKNNGMAFGGLSTTMRNHDDLEDEFEDSGFNNEAGSIQNMDSRWNNDAGPEVKLNSPMFNSQPKQTILKQFFKAPVKCLTNVLMAGARQVAKREAILKATPITKKSHPSGLWGSNNRRNGSCPYYKRIPGTDFICDGFQFATSSLSENYFLTHFHSDVSYYLSCCMTSSPGKL